MITVSEKTFTEHQPQSDLLVGSFLDLEEGFLLSDQHLPGKVRVRYQVDCAWPNAESDNVTVLGPGLLHCGEQVMATEVPQATRQKVTRWAWRTLSFPRCLHRRSNHDL